MKSADRVSILAVDDSPEKLYALSVLLSELGEDVVTASSGREALRLLLNREFAVVLLDVNMPGMDGFETAALIRQRKASEHTPIIFITSYGDDMHALRGYSLGAVDYILAPVEPDVLKTKVAVFVELFKKTAQVRQQARDLADRAAQLQTLTQASLAINAALSPERMLQIVTSWTRDVLNAHQAGAIVAQEQKWSAAKTAVAVSPEYAQTGARRILRDRTALLSFLSRIPGPVRIPRADFEESARWPELASGDSPARLGWIAAPMTGRDGRHMGLLYALERREKDFTPDDEMILAHLAQISSIAFENVLNAEAREANRIKDEFLTMLSHELRTPLSAILGWTRILRAEPSEPERVNHGLEVIERNVLAQKRLIDDLLDVSRMITGKLRLNVRPIELIPVVQAAMESMRPAAEARDISIVLAPKLTRGQDGAVGDPDRLQQVVWNLLSNAIKFTPPGGRVEIGLERDDEQFRIRVSDTGRGILPDFLPHVFDRFRQADSSSTRAHSGLGIGLAIARHIVELHGGSVGAESPGEGRGATFWISLPAVAVGLEKATVIRVPAAEAAFSPAPPFASLAGLRVLVVEDDPDGRELLREALSYAGAQVEAAASASEAYAALTARPPDVLVSDIGMPHEDGYALIQRIRELPPESGGSVPAVAVTAYAREEDQIRATAAGFHRHVPKPFEPAVLVAAVGEVARRPWIEPAPPEAPAAEPSPEPLRVLVVEDDEDSREGLRQLLEIWGHAVDTAENAAEAIEKAITSRPGVALIDIGLPEVDGYQVAQRIRLALGTDGIFLVAVTGYADDEARQRVMAAGFDAHMPKPINTSALSRLLAAR